MSFSTCPSTADAAAAVRHKRTSSASSAGSGWFSQQAEWNLYSYQCAATIESLPFEYKLLWHNETIDHPFLSNCNLPGIWTFLRLFTQNSQPH